MRKNAVYLIVILGFAALIAGALWFQHDLEAQNKYEFQATVLNNPRKVESFALTGTDHKIFDQHDLKNKWTMMFFGFTRCGTICPATMSELGKMYKKLETDKVKQLPQVVMISLDPERDTIEKLHDYVKTFNPAFYGATSTPEAVEKMAAEMGVAYAKVALAGQPQAENYDIQHTGTIMLFNPQGKLTAFFTNPHDAEKLALDYVQLVKKG